MYRLVIFFVIMILLSVSGCKDKSKIIDLGISDDKLTNLIVDMHYLEGIIQKTHKSEKDSIRNLIKDKIIKIYEIKSTEELDSLLSKAQSYPQYFKEIQLKAFNILDSLEKEVSKPMDAKDKK